MCSKQVHAIAVICIRIRRNYSLVGKMQVFIAIDWLRCGCFCFCAMCYNISYAYHVTAIGRIYNDVDLICCISHVIAYVGDNISTSVGCRDWYDVGICVECCCFTHANEQNLCVVCGCVNRDGCVHTTHGDVIIRGMCCGWLNVDECNLWYGIDNCWIRDGGVDVESVERYEMFSAMNSWETCQDIACHTYTCIVPYPPSYHEIHITWQLQITDKHITTSWPPCLIHDITTISVCICVCVCVCVCA